MVVRRQRVKTPLGARIGIASEQLRVAVLRMLVAVMSELSKSGRCVCSGSCGGKKCILLYENNELQLCTCAGTRCVSNNKGYQGITLFPIVTSLSSILISHPIRGLSNGRVPKRFTAKILYTYLEEAQSCGAHRTGAHADITSAFVNRKVK